MVAPEAESREKHGVWDPPKPELNITSPYVHSRVDYNTFTMGIGQPYARVDLNPMPESILTLCQSLLYPPVRDFGFGLRLSISSLIQGDGMGTLMLFHGLPCLILGDDSLLNTITIFSSWNCQKLTSEQPLSGRRLHA
jgi:hypothetical protein